VLTEKEIKAYARECGFIDCGITTADDFPEYERALDRLISLFPGTENFYMPMYKRARIKERVPWAKSVIVCMRDYGKYKIPANIIGYIGRNYLFDSRVSQNPDFQAIKDFTGYLRDGGLKVRKGGLPDRLAAARAGVGRIGKNNFVYSAKAGSWVNTVTYIVGAELVPDEPAMESPCPEGCDLCIKACPTGALSSPYTVRMDYCVAYLTYGGSLPVPKELSAKMGNWIYGCDACQEACPLNRGKWKEQFALPHLGELSCILTPKGLSEMDELTYRNKIHPLFPYIPVEDMKRWHDNAKRALKFVNEQGKTKR